MKTNIIELLVIISLTTLSTNTSAQIYDIQCPDLVVTKFALEAQTGGKFKPSSNSPGQYLRILFVFAQFNGDTSVHSNWTYGQLPDYHNKLVDSIVSSSYRAFTLSDYWKTMSFGNFDIIGNVYPNLVTLRPESWYLSNNKSWQDANKDVLDSINGKINFKQYDNWGFDSNTQSFYFSPGNADGYLDMMYIIYRSPDPNRVWFPFDGIAMLGQDFTYITHDSTIIDGRGFSHLSSGITVRRGASMNYPDFLTRILCHEYGHYLFGAGHIQFSGIMSLKPESHSHFLCSWEREKLGYIAYTSAYQNGFTISLGDYITTGQVLKVPIPGANSSYFLVENHQRLNRYDQITRGGILQGAFDTSTTIGKGIYIWLISGDNYPPNITSVSATGRWNWQYDGDFYAGPGWGQTGYLPKTKKESINRDNGKDDRYPLHIFITNNPNLQTGWHAKYVDINPLTKEYEIMRNCMGLPEHAFNVNSNNLFTAWSNPSSKFSNNNTDISIQIFSQSGNYITVKVFTTYNSALALPPSKPQFLRTLVNNNFVTLSWEPNIEPDMYPNGKYKIYRGYTTNNQPPNNYSLIATINAYNGSNPVNSWTDPDIFGGSGTQKLFYRIVAVDNSNLHSVSSDWDWVYWDKSIQKGNANNSIINNYMLYPNYPNPFNPLTTIQYDIKEAGIVQLKVYDILGNEIADLVNEYKERGTYRINFNAEHLPSGVYIYSIKVNDFIQNQKMTLLK